jgi:hypothetical protein
VKFGGGGCAIANKRYISAEILMVVARVSPSSVVASGSQSKSGVGGFNFFLAQGREKKLKRERNCAVAVL